MSTLADLFAHNRAWAAQMESERPGFFSSLTKQQAPKYMWIGCSDSRVPANQITGTKPGEVFVHRNIANVCAHSDMNMLSVLDYAVNVLKVKHVIVAGHYGCGGVAAGPGGCGAADRTRLEADAGSPGRVEQGRPLDTSTSVIEQHDSPEQS